MTRKNDRRTRALRPALEAMESRVVLSANPLLVNNPHAVQEAAVMVAQQIVQYENNVTARYGIAGFQRVLPTLSSPTVVGQLLLKTGLPSNQVTWAAYFEVEKDVSIGLGPGGAAKLNILEIQ